MHTVHRLSDSYWSGWFTYAWKTRNIFHMECWRIVMETEKTLLSAYASDKRTQKTEEKGSQGVVTQLVVELDTQLKLRQLCSGVAHVVFLTECQQVYALGYNSFCQLGVLSEEIRYTATPLNITNRMNGEESFVPHFISAGPYQTFVVFKTTLDEKPGLDEPLETRVYSFGRNDFGHLGHGTCVPRRQLPGLVVLPKSHKVKKVISGAYHALALTYQGVLIGWGSNKEQQLGPSAPHFLSNPTPFVLNFPLPCTFSLGAVEAMASLWHSFFVFSDQSVFQMGRNCIPSHLPCTPCILSPSHSRVPNMFRWTEVWTTATELSIKESSESHNTPLYGEKTQCATEAFFCIPMLQGDHDWVLKSLSSNSLVHCALRQSQRKQSYQVIYWSEDLLPYYVLSLPYDTLVSCQGMADGEPPITAFRQEEILKPPQTLLFHSPQLDKPQCCVGKQALYLLV